MPLIAGAVGAPVVGGILGGIFGSGSSNQAENAYQQAANSALSIQAPTLDTPLQLQQYKSLGTYNPILEQAIQSPDSAVGQISTDPALRQAQMQALNLIQQRSRTGLSPSDMASINQVRMAAQSDTEAKRQQIMQNFAQRGQGGMGAELAAQLQGAQAGANSEAQQGLQLAGIASQNALAAAAQSGQLGGQIRGQDFGEAQTRAQAIDELNRFRTSLSSQQQARNAAAQTGAAQYGQQTAQQASSANVGNANAELQRQVAAKQQMFQDQLAKAQAAAGAYSGLGNMYQQQAQQTRQGFQNIGSGIGAGLGSVATFNALKGLSSPANPNNAIRPDNSSGEFGG